MAFVRVQGTASDNAISLAFGSTVGSGHLVIGAYCWDTSTGLTLNSVTDDKSNTYTISDNINDAPDGQGLAVFFCNNITNGAKTVTVTLSGATPALSILGIEEWSGASTAVDPRDGHTGQVQTTVAATTDAVKSGSVTTTVNGDLVWGVTSPGSGTPTITKGTGFTQGFLDASAELMSEYLTQGSAGPAQATYTSNVAGDNWITIVTTIQPPGAGAAAVTSFVPTRRAMATLPAGIQMRSKLLNASLPTQAVVVTTTGGTLPFMGVG